MSRRIYWTSSRNPTGRPLEFCKFASNDLELPISSRNAIKNFTGRPLENSRGRPVEFTGCPVKSTGRPLEFSRGRPLEQKIWPNVFYFKSFMIHFVWYARLLCIFITC